MGLNRDFLELVERQFATADFDAVHPTHLYLIERFKLDREQAVWLVMLYMGFYNEGSAWAAFSQSDPFTVPPVFRIERNRRNLYGGRVRDHFQALADGARAYGSGYEFLTQEFDDDSPAENWRRLLGTLRGVYGNGRWAAFTTADHLHKVCKLPVRPTDIENAGSSGPADGLRRAFGLTASSTLDAKDDLEHLNELAEQALDAILTYVDVKVPYLDDGHVDMGMVESVLCDWSGLARGSYYSGRNIDRMQARIVDVMTSFNIGKLDVLWEAREAVFDRRHLGEFNGWAGIDTDRLKHYARTGEVLWSHERR